MTKFLIGLGVIAAMLAIFYNGLVSLRIETQKTQADVEAQLQRRFDLVPNLVESVKGAMAQEKDVFKAIADARTHYAGAAPGTEEKLAAGQEYEGALSRLLVIMENYPQLKSVDVVQDLMTQLEGTENRISVARQYYNESVRPYNRTLQSFPTNIIAGMFGFKEAKFFKGVDGSETAPKVNFTK